MGKGGFTEDAIQEYVRCCTPANIHGVCEDYRAGATIDYEMDKKDLEDRAGDLVPSLEVLLVHLVVDRGSGAIVLTHAVDVLRCAAPHVLLDRVFAEPALAQALRAELEADVVLLLA